MCASFYRPTSRIGVLEQSRYSASIERMLVCHAKRVNMKMAIIMAATKISCSIAMLAAKSKAQCRTCTYSTEIFTSAFAKNRFTSKWWFSSKVKAWNFTKYKNF